MKAQELRGMDLADLEAKVLALREDLFRIRFRHQIAQLADASEIKKTQRTLARALTILGERRSADAGATSQAEG